jgi:hypothetical protein
MSERGDGALTRALLRAVEYEIQAASRPAQERRERATQRHAVQGSGVTTKCDS